MVIVNTFMKNFWIETINSHCFERLTDVWGSCSLPGIFPYKTRLQDATRKVSEAAGVR